MHRLGTIPESISASSDTDGLDFPNNTSYFEKRGGTGRQTVSEFPLADDDSLGSLSGLYCFNPLKPRLGLGFRQ